MLLDVILEPQKNNYKKIPEIEIFGALPLAAKSSLRWIVLYIIISCLSALMKMVFKASVPLNSYISNFSFTA